MNNISGCVRNKWALYIPVTINMTRDGSASLLNCLPILIMIFILSCKLKVPFRVGAITNPMNTEPPSHIDAVTKWIQVIIACSIVNTNIKSQMF